MIHLENRRIKRLDILVTTLCRPHLLKKLAETLSNQVGYDHLHIRTILFADNVILKDGTLIGSPEDAEECINCFIKILPNTLVMRSPHNLGICGNFARINNHMISSEADAFLFLEEDLLLRSDYLVMITDLLEVTAQNKNIGLVSGVPGVALTQQEQEGSVSRLIPIGHKWSFALTSENAKILCPMLKIYLDYCESIDFLCNGRDNTEKLEAVQYFLSQYDYPTLVQGTGPDAAIDIMSNKLGLYGICTRPSYGISTGRVGLHFTNTQFEAMNLHRVTMYEGRRVPHATSAVDEVLRSSIDHKRKLLLESIS